MLLAAKVLLKVSRLSIMSLKLVPDLLRNPQYFDYAMRQDGFTRHFIMIILFKGIEASFSKFVLVYGIMLQILYFHTF